MKEARESWEKVNLYGPGACSYALNSLKEEFDNLDGNESNEIIRINHAMLLVRLNESGSIIDCLEKLIKCGESISGEEWKYAVSSIRLLDLYDDTEAWGNRQIQKEELFENYIISFIKNLENIKGTKKGYEEGHNRYALGYLLFLYHRYRLELCLDADKAFKAGEAEYKNGHLDKANKYIEKSIKLLENNTFLHINRNLVEEKIDKHIENAKENFEIKDLPGAIGDLNNTFGIIYQKYGNDAKDCLVSAEEIFNQESKPKESSPGFNFQIQEYINFLIESGQLYLKFGEYKDA